MAPKRKYSKKSKGGEINEKQNDLFEGQRYFKDPKKISEHLICSICQDVFEDPWVLTCGHSFCKRCIDSWLVDKSICPIDRLTVNKHFGAKNFSLGNIIGDLTIACPWRPYGCDTIDRYYMVKDHQGKCRFNPNKMDPVIRDKILKDIPDTIPSFASNEPVALNNHTSTLDELMAQIENEPLEDSIIEDDLTALPVLEEPSLVARLYMKQDDSSNILLNMLDNNRSVNKVPRKL